ncbi:MAG: threonine synthase [Hyphomicrobiaceae bacterium]
MQYISTRGQAPVLNFDDVVLAGLARDGGLYLPQTWPKLTQDQIAGFAGRPFHEVAVAVIAPFTGGTISRTDLTRMAKDAYGQFGHAAVTPLVQIGPGTWVLELFHGPTLAFKDVAMQLLARMMDHVLERRGQRATIVGATSGDTGGAAIEAFRGSKRVDIVILYPQGRVSDVQRRMMTTPAEANVHAVAIDGNFDDCQALVKGMFNDHAFRDGVGLSGVNSINWGRIVAQATYYFVAAAALGAPHREISFVVPTGNFGDIFAGYVAKQMGLPIETLTIASNSNDILARTVETGVYEMRPVAATSSPSMDIGVSSNFERYLFEASGRDSDLIRAQMAALAQSGRFELSPALHSTLKSEFTASSATEGQVASAIGACRNTTGYTADPHTACGLVAAQRMAASTVPQVILATASPAKFPDVMEVVTGRRPGLPPRLSHLLTDGERTQLLPNDLAAVQAFVAANARSHAAGSRKGSIA